MSSFPEIRRAQNPSRIATHKFEGSVFVIVLCQRVADALSLPMKIYLQQVAW